MRRAVIVGMVVCGCFTDTDQQGSGATAEVTTGGSASSTSAAQTSSSTDASSSTTTTGGTTSTSATASSTGTGAPSDCPEQIEFTFDDLTSEDGVDDLIFPVSFDAETINYVLTLADGSDVSFRGPDVETILPSEVDTFRPAGDSVFWVRMPRIDADSDRLFVCYGTGVAAPPSPAGGVWGEEYLAVWHFSEDLGDGDPLLDATGNGHEGVRNSGGALESQNTPLGSGVEFTRDGEYMVVPTTSFDIGSAATIEIVARATIVDPPTFSQAIGRVDSFGFLLLDGTGARPAVTLAFDVGGTLTVPATADTPLVWAYMTGLYEASTGEAVTCLDGTSCAMATGTVGSQIFDNMNTDIRIGRVDAIIDEVRIANVRRSDAWVRAAARGYDGSLLNRL